MKKNVFLLYVMMMAMMVTSVGLTGCSKDDDGVEVTQSDLNGTWTCVNQSDRVLMAALTFSNSGKEVMAHFEGAWFDCKVERTPDSMTLTGYQVRMATFTDFGNYLAKVVKPNITITFDYVKNGQQLDIRNVKITPEIVTSLKQNYTLMFDKVYAGNAGVIYH